MKQIITFSNGGIFEVTADGCIITSITGEVMRFGADGVGNTYKVVKDFEVGFSLCGGGYNKYGDNIPVADVAYYDCPDFSSNFGSGVLVLKK